MCRATPTTQTGKGADRVVRKVKSSRSFVVRTTRPIRAATQDSNLQPDRYERPALTIELQAPRSSPAREGTGPAPLTMWLARRAVARRRLDRHRRKTFDFGDLRMLR